MPGKRLLSIGLGLAIVALGCRSQQSQVSRGSARIDAAGEAAAPGERGRVIAPGDHQFDLQVGALKRQYFVHVPPGYDGRTPTPVVIMFHGGGGTAEATMKETHWDAKSDQAGFLMVLPEGAREHPDRRARFVGNPQTWNDGSGRFYAGENNIDDVGFTYALIDDLIARFNVDQRRIYATGFSNGSSMVYRLGVELAPRLAAIAPMSSSGLRIKATSLARPVPMLTIHGAADPRNPIEGGDVETQGKIDSRPAVSLVVEHWAWLCGCTGEPHTLRDSGGVKAIAYGPCKENAEVVFYTVEDMGHTWAGGESVLSEKLVGKVSNKLRANDVIWEFFDKHPMPQ